MDSPVYSYQRLFRYSLDPSGKLVHKKDGTVSMTVWSRAASSPSLSSASLRSWLSAFWASSLMFAQSTSVSGQCYQFNCEAKGRLFRAALHGFELKFRQTLKFRPD